MHSWHPASVAKLFWHLGESMPNACVTSRQACTAPGTRPFNCCQATDRCLCYVVVLVHLIEGSDPKLSADPTELVCCDNTLVERR